MFHQSTSARTANFNELSPQEMLDELRSEMKAIRTKETALKRQIMDLNEQFQDVIKSAAEIAKESTRSSMATTNASRSGTNQPLVNSRSNYHSRFHVNNRSKAAVKADTSALRYRTSRAKLGLRTSLGERLKTRQNQARVPRAQARGSATPSTDFPTDLSPTFGVNPQKIRSSLPTSPVEGEDEMEGSLGEMAHRRKKNIKKRMIDSRKVDVVHLGLF